MPSIESAIRTILATDSLIFGVVGSGVHVEYAPQNAARPYVIITVVDSNPLRDFGGYSGLTQSRIQVDVVTDSASSRAQLRDYVRQTLGNRNKWSNGGTFVQACQLVSERQNSIPPADGGERMIRRQSMDFFVQWNDSAITV